MLRCFLVIPSNVLSFVLVILIIDSINGYYPSWFNDHIAEQSKVQGHWATKIKSLEASWQVPSYSEKDAKFGCKKLEFRTFCSECSYSTPQSLCNNIPNRVGLFAPSKSKIKQALIFCCFFPTRWLNSLHLSKRACNDNSNVECLERNLCRYLCIFNIRCG